MDSIHTVPIADALALGDLAGIDPDLLTEEESAALPKPAGEASDADRSPKVMPEPGDATKPGSPAAAEDASKAGTSAKASKSPSRLFHGVQGAGRPSPLPSKLSSR